MTTPIARLRPLIGALLALSLLMFGAPWGPSQAVSAQNQQLFLSVTDADGAPVTDLTPDELIVRWDDQDCETLDLEPIDWPVRITIFVDNGAGSQDALQNMREGLKTFVDKIPEEVEIALATIAGRPRFVTRHTSDREDIASGIDLIVPDAGASARFRDALIEEGERLDDDDERQYFPVILMVASDGPEGSSTQQEAYDEMVGRMIAASATVHTRMYTTGQGQGAQVPVAMNLSEATRGSYESMAVSTGFRDMLPALGEEIARKHRLVSNQYRVTYAPPDGISNPTSMGISTNREGILLAPTLDGNVQ